jgi:hypothetical protein
VLKGTGEDSIAVGAIRSTAAPETQHLHYRFGERQIVVAAIDEVNVSNRGVLVFSRAFPFWDLLRWMALRPAALV